MPMQPSNPFWPSQDQSGLTPGGAWGAIPQTPAIDPRMTPRPAPSIGSPNPFAPDARRAQPNALYGRVVVSPEDIMPNEVPMDGTPSFFPKADFSCIYGRKWMPDGRIVPVTFVPMTETQDVVEENQNGATMEEILDRLSTIQNLLTSFSVDSEKSGSQSKKKEGEKK